MTSLTHLGLNHRTKLMDREAAERFARCLQGNPRFSEVNVNASRSEGRFFVTFQPASDQRYRQLLGAAQGERHVRALGEGEGYVFVEDETRRFWWVLNPRSGETYEVHEHGCSCPDHLYRCSRVGLKCKHQLALVAGVGIRGEF